MFNGWPVARIRRAFKRRWRQWWASEDGTLFRDIAHYLPNFEVRTIVDVGGHHGESAIAYSKRFPRARIFTIEADPRNFQRLAAACARIDTIEVFNLALSRSEGLVTLLRHDSDTMHRVVEAVGSEPADGKCTVNAVTLDSFCRSNDITMVDILKVDTEGHELSVLQGGAAIFEERRVGLIKIECGMNPGKHLHVPLEVIKDHLEQRGYLMFRIYGQVHEWPTGEPHLRRVDAVFISPDIIKSNTLRTMTNAS